MNSDENKTLAEPTNSIQSFKCSEPARMVRADVDLNHLFLSMVAFVKLKAIKVKGRLNHFALKARLTQNALKQSWQVWQQYKQTSALLALYA